MINFLKLFKTSPKSMENITKEPNRNESVVGFNSLIYNNGQFTYYNPDELYIKKGNAVYQKMMKDEQIKACLALKKSSVLARGYSFHIDDDNNEQQKLISDFFWHMINMMEGSFTDKLRGILSGLQNGFSISEKVHAPFEWNNKTYWGVTDIKLKPFDTFTFKVDQYGNTKGLLQSVSLSSETPIPMDKVIHWVHQSDINKWYGESDLRSTYRAWWSKDIIIKFQNIHLERHGSGFPVVKPTEAGRIDQATKNQLLTMMQNMSVRNGFYLPPGYELEIIQPQVTDAFEKAIAQYDKAISKALLLPNLLGFSEQGQTGSYAQSQTQFIAFLDLVIEDLCASVAETLNEQFFSELALWNFGTVEYPKFQFDPMTRETKIELAKVWSQLVKDSTVKPSDQDEGYVRNLIGFPEKEEVEEEPEDVIEEPEIPITADEYTLTIPNTTWSKRVNFKAIEKSMDESTDTFITDLTTNMGLARLALEKQITKIAGDRSFGNIQLKEFTDLQIPKKVLSDVRKLIRKHLNKSYTAAYSQAFADLPKKNNTQFVLNKSSAEKFLASKALTITGILDSDILKSIQQLLSNGILYDKTLKEIMLALDQEANIIALLPQIDSIGRAVNRPARLETIVRTNVTEAVNQGRESLFKQPEYKGFIQAYEFSSVLDTNTSDICEKLNGRIRKDWGSYTPPLHHNCRSILVPVTVIDDWNGKEDNIPSTVKPSPGFV